MGNINLVGEEMKKVITICLIIFLGLLYFPDILLATTKYTITEVVFDTNSYSQIIKGVNNSGQVVGWGAYDGSYNRSFFWENGSASEINAGDGDVTVSGINNLGEVVGSYNDHAFRWTKEWGMIDISPADITRSYAVGINDLGDIVGGSYKIGDDYPNRKTLWKDGQVYVDTSPWYLYFTSINNTGRIAGGFGSGSSGSCPLTFSSSPVWHYYDPCRPQDGGYWDWDLRELSSGGNGSNAVANSINDDGQVVGVVLDKAILYSSSGEATDLGNLGGRAEAKAINNLGQIVGDAALDWSSWPDYSAFLWENGVMYDLNNLVLNGEGWILQRAIDISDTGYIVGSGQLNGQDTLFFLSLIPDYYVNFRDFALFALHWLDTDCGTCGGADLTGDGNVNNLDLKKFAENWLSGE